MSDKSLVDVLIGGDASLDLSLEELEGWGIALGAAVSRPIVITLKGDLGAGKTTLTRAICAGLGVVDVSAVTSPTFAILQEYAATNGPVTHADLYRLRSEAELDALGWDEIVDRAGVLIVEWPERTKRAWPTGTITIFLSYPEVGLESRVLQTGFV
ncbi:MAG: tRNA (adenosine(37)-N6)-threonylcarbamoyltransferase complex ATPase subunit type 1 TsaE [Gemmatimonadaceae bacterium]